MELDPRELDRIATIARIPLDPAHRGELAGELEGILEHFRVLAEMVEPGSHEERGVQGTLRADEVETPDPDELEGILDAFPRRRDGLLEVPRGL